MMAPGPYEVRSMRPGGERRHLGQTVRFQEILCRLAMIDEGFVEDQAVLVLGLSGVSALDAGTAALPRLGTSAAQLRSRTAADSSPAGHDELPADSKPAGTKLGGAS
jgi:hypothetical protein